MTRERQRLLLIVAAVAFCSWIGWLGFLAVTTTRPVVLSRPQFLVSQIDVTAQVSGDPQRPDAAVKIVAVYKGGALKQDATIQVTNLPQVTPEDGWAGPGAYILPLQKSGDAYQVAPIPRSPGFSASRLRIYPATPQTLEQLQQLDRP